MPLVVRATQLGLRNALQVHHFPYVKKSGAYVVRDLRLKVKCTRSPEEKRASAACRYEALSLSEHCETSGFDLDLGWKSARISAEDLSENEIGTEGLDKLFQARTEP